MSAGGSVLGPRAASNEPDRYLLERQRLGPLLGRPRLPHADGGAGAAGDDQLQVGTDGAEDLTPLRETLVHHQRLDTSRVEVTHLHFKHFNPKWELNQDQFIV